MKAWLWFFCWLWLPVALVGQAPVPPTARAIVQRAIRAHGGEANLSRLKAGHAKTDGVIERSGASISFTQEAYYQLPDQLKETQVVELNDQKRRVTIVLNGQQGWINGNGQTAPLSQALLEELQEAAYLLRLTRLTPLLDKRFELSPEGRSQVNGRSVSTIKVSSRLHRDTKLYFDDQTGLLVKIERRTREIPSLQEVTEERIYSDFRDIDGLRTPQKTVVYRDGKKFMSADVAEVKFFESLDESTFSKP
jgi:hypothetical protein